MSDGAKNRPLKRMPIDVLMGKWGLENNPIYHVMDALSRVASPHQLNPMNMNPLRDLLEESIDFSMVRRCTAFKLFISATNVESGKVKDRRQVDRRVLLQLILPMMTLGTLAGYALCPWLGDTILESLFASGGPLLDYALSGVRLGRRPSASRCS